MPTRLVEGIVVSWRTLPWPVWPKLIGGYRNLLDLSQHGRSPPGAEGMT